MIKLIAIDLDGTLLNSQHQMTERTEKTLKTALAQGLKIVLATGKTRYSGNTIIERLGLTTPGVYLQGLAVHYHDNSVRHQLTLNPDVARRVITFAEDRGFDVVAYSGTRILVRASDPASDELHTRYHEPKPEAVGPLQNILNGTQINKLLIIKTGDARKITALRWQLNMQLNAKEARLTQALPDMLEVLPPGASKGSALKTLIKEMDVKPEEVLAMGDAENDIEMIQLAGIGVAMGNAHEKLKAVADYVVSSNDEDGVAEAVERFALKKEEAKVEPEASTDTEAEIAVITATDVLKSEANTSTQDQTKAESPAPATTVSENASSDTPGA